MSTIGLNPEEKTPIVRRDTLNSIRDRLTDIIGYLNRVDGRAWGLRFYVLGPLPDEKPKSESLKTADGFIRDIHLFLDDITRKIDSINTALEHMQGAVE